MPIPNVAIRVFLALEPNILHISLPNTRALEYKTTCCKMEANHLSSITHPSVISKITGIAQSLFSIKSRHQVSGVIMSANKNGIDKSLWDVLIRSRIRTSEATIRVCWGKPCLCLHHILFVSLHLTLHRYHGKFPHFLEESFTQGVPFLQNNARLYRQKHRY